MTDTTVKYYHSGMVGAPVLSGTAGAVVAILDACLVNGWGTVTLDSLIVASNVATASKSTGMTYDIGAVVTIAGATPSGLNGEQKVTATTANTVSFATSGITDQTATGTITLKLSPAGWAKTYTGTNKGAYKPTDVTATGCLLRVDDAGTKTCRVVGYETMTDVDTGTGAFPTSTQRSGGNYWTKSETANSTAKSWMLVSDGKMFYFAREYFFTSFPNAYELHAFGDIIPSKSGDPYACVLSAESTDKSASPPASQDNYWFSVSSGSSELYTPRSYTGLGSAAIMRKTMPAMMQNSSTWSSGLIGTTPFPNPSDGGLYVVPHYVSDSVSISLRGTSPGFYGCPQNVPNGQFTTRDSVTGVAGMTGKTLKALTCASSNYGVAFFDLTGPWR